MVIPIYAGTILQESISLSFADAEFTALAEECTSVVWLRKALNELGLGQGTDLISKDNNGAINRAEGGPAKHFARCTHIDIKFNYVMELVVNGSVKLSKVDTVDMIADYLTEALTQRALPLQLCMQI